jgi:hypothetical protein
MLSHRADPATTTSFHQELGAYFQVLKAWHHVLWQTGRYQVL